MRLWWLLRRLSAKSKTSVNALRGASGTGGMPLSFVSVGILGAFLGSYILLVLGFAFVADGYLSLRSPTAITSWEQDFVDDAAALHESLTSRTPNFESSIFTWVVNRGLASVHKRAGEALENGGASDRSIFTVISIALWQGFFRGLYIVLWWLRLLVMAIVGAAAWRYSHFGPHVGKDMLASFTNGRMFYSGIRAVFARIDERGEPNLLAPGVVTVPALTGAELQSHPLITILTDSGALCGTTRALVARIALAKHVPGYVGPKGVSEDSVADGVVLTLPEYTERLLSSALRVQRTLASSSVAINNPATEELDIFYRAVLTPQQRKNLGALPPKLVATAVLALLAGRILAYSRDTGMWVVRSLFPNLSSRALLHSIPDFAAEFSPQERETVRRALVYATRQGVFTAVQLPVNISPELSALRQWTELISMPPDEIPVKVKELELFALLSEVHDHWCHATAAAIRKNDASFLNGAYAGVNDLLFMPLQNMLGLVEGLLDQDKLTRISILVTELSELPRLNEIEDPWESQSVFALRPLDKGTIERVVTEQKVTEKDLLAWNGVRYVLQFYGWLAARVGNRPVNQSALISCAIRYVDVFSHSSEPQLVRADGVIAIRGARLRELIADAWQNNIAEAASVVLVGGAQESVVAGAGSQSSEDISLVADLKVQGV